MTTKKGTTGGYYTVNFIPLHNHWMGWEADNLLHIIHETCYHELAMNHEKLLPFFSQGNPACAWCGEEAPENLQKLVKFKNGVRDYGTPSENKNY